LTDVLGNGMAANAGASALTGLVVPLLGALVKGKKTA
jgi:hypothetical protein